MGTVSIETLPEDARAVAKLWHDRYHQGKDRHEATRRKIERYYALYRSYKEFKRTYSDTRPKDVDSLMRDAQAGFGADLFIPYVFSTVETTLARMLAQNPTLGVSPAPTVAGVEALMKAERNAENHQVLLHKQQSMIDYYLTVQDVGKASLMFGTGVGKVLWDQRWQKGRKVLKPATVPEVGGPAWVLGTEDKLIYEGPSAEYVSLWDFIHDPRGHSIKTMRWAIHRMWMSDEEITEKIKRGVWELPEGVELEDVLALGSSEGREELWLQRDTYAGLPTESQIKEKLHAVWECHDGATVTTMIDGVCPVQHGENPFWHGELCFQLARPTRVPEEFLGIGEPEAIEDLQEEMNVMRTQRRDNAAFVLQRPFAYFDGLVDPDADFVWAPGVGLPVDGDPSTLLYFPDVPDIPFSSYQEEDRLQRDIERVTGIDDTVSGAAGGGGATGTATGVQMVQQAAGIRIANKTKLLEQEFVKAQSRQFLHLNQQKMGVGEGGTDRPLHMLGPPRKDDPEGIERGASAYELGPATLEGDFEVEPEGESMSPQNTVEKANRGREFFQMFGNDPYVDPMKVREFALENMGYANPRSILREQEEQISQDQLAAAAQVTAEQLGVDPDLLLQALEENVNAAQEQEALAEQMAVPGTVAPEQQQAPSA